MRGDESGFASREADRAWVSKALGRMPPVAASPGFVVAILAGFDAPRQRPGLMATLAQIVWPGAPAWAPASALALALIIGIGAGVVLPSQAQAQSSAPFSLEAPASFDLAQLDWEMSDWLAGDTQ